MKNKDEQWDLIIKPNAGLFNLNLREVWRYRDLLILFVKRDFVAQYKQTILGPVWHLLQPALTTAMFLLLFSRIAKIPTDGINPVLFYITGITFWNYFSTCLTGTSLTFISNASIFGKVYFPRLVMPLATIISSLVKFGFQFTLLLLGMLWFYLHGESTPITLNWLWIIPLLLVLALTGLGMGILISALTTKYRDFNVLVTFGIQLAMYGTPVVYPLTYVRTLKIGWLIELNPITPLMEAFRFALYGQGLFTVSSILYSVVFMFVVLFLGLVFFNKVEKSFVDTV